ncbi:BZ3500_MvSof-1268-A1-R1_Chr9g10405 [Microbotryum saponariae]|uniref:Exocyst complex protein EXO70 n=1 Tax=Microbotryum saponariae TaxID=289078 RepID=A0A2X0L6C4_9BASI|nr:BZ3501_MvSof-1269-A2-R1_Chr9g10155 [Microbotryum saponariae]SDA00038.1 BZ3500_MvSof-1268-A1-R1_Chr9g10405 [Microbotryum saponariae]
MAMYTRFQPTASTSNSASIALEQSNADLTLLNQSLAKSKRITDKMTSRLGDFDDRLARLEKSLVPIHKQTGRLTRLSKNLESTLKSIQGLLGHHDLVTNEQELISVGPDPNDLKPYLDAIDRLTIATEAVRKTDAKGNGALGQMVSYQRATLDPTTGTDPESFSSQAGLVESGAQQLVAVFRQWVHETSPQIDAGSLYDKGKPFPTLTPTFVDSALPLIAYIRALPEVGPRAFKDLQIAYGQERASFVEAALANASKDVLTDATPMLSASDMRRSLGRFLDVMFGLLKSEYALLSTVFANVPPSTRREIYSNILPPSLSLFYATGTQLNGVVKKALDALVPIAFSTFSELQEQIAEFEEWVRIKAARKDNELGELLHAFRGTCLTSLPAMIDTTKQWGARGISASESGAGVGTVTFNVVNFMRQLSDNQTVVEGFLNVLGPGNWGGPKIPVSTRDGDEEQSLLTRYLNDVLQTLLAALDQRAKGLRARSGISAIFLLNNVSFIRREVLSSQVGDVLGEACEDALNKLMRTTKASYLEIWSPLVSALLDAGLEQSGAAGAIKAAVKGGGGGGNERAQTKDRFLRFGDGLQEVENLHAVAKLDEGEQELKERLKGEVERMIVPTYTKFLAKHRNGDFSKNPEKYLKLDADQLEARIQAIFE